MVQIEQLHIVVTCSHVVPKLNLLDYHEPPRFAPIKTLHLLLNVGVHILACPRISCSNATASSTTTAATCIALQIHGDLDKWWWKSLGWIFWARVDFDEGTPFPWGGGIVDQHMANLEGAAMRQGKKLMVAFYPVAPWFGCGFFWWLKQNVPVPTQTYGAEETWFRAQPWKATAVAQHSTSRHYDQAKTSRKFPQTWLRTTAQTSSHGYGGYNGGKTNHCLLALPDNKNSCTSSHVDSSRILHY